MQTIKENLLSSTSQLSLVSDSAKLDSELLLAFTLSKPRSYLYAWEDEKISDKDQSKFNRLLARRIKGEPIAHILGERGFWSLDLKVTADTLIPRPDTERLVELALDIIPQQANWKILDMGTGGYRPTLSRDIANTATLVDSLDNIALYIIACQAAEFEIGRAAYDDIIDPYWGRRI